MPIFFSSTIPVTSSMVLLLPRFNYLEVTYEKQFQNPYSAHIHFLKYYFNGFFTF